MSEREDVWAAAMRGARQGDRRSYERLLADIASVVRVVVRRKFVASGLSAAEIEDVVQEVLLGIHLKRSTWDERRPITPWVYAIARHKITDAMRRLGRLGRFETDMPRDVWAATAATEIDGDRSLLDLERCLDGLPRKQASVVRALALDGTTIKATAQRLSMSEGAVRVAFHRALTRLSQQIASAPLCSRKVKG